MTDTQDLTVLPPQQRAIMVMRSDTVGQELAALVASTQSITAVTNPDGRAECHSAAMAARSARVNLEKTGKAARDDATAFSKAVIAEQTRLVAIIEPEQDRLLQLRDEYDAKIEDERAAKAEAERVRVSLIRSCMDNLRDTPITVVGKNSETIRVAIDLLEVAEIGDDYAEFSGEAEAIKRASLASLQDLLTAAMATEAEAARVAEEVRIAAEKTELARVASEAEAERVRVENERIRAENEAAAAALKAGRDELDRQRKANESAIAEEREKVRKEAEALQSAKIEAERQEAVRLERIRADEEARDSAKAKAEAEEADRLANERFIHATIIIDEADEATAKALSEAEDTGATMKLGQISERLGFTVTADFMASIGIPFVAQEKEAKLYRASDFLRICQAIANHVLSVAAKRPG